MSDNGSSGSAPPVETGVRGTSRSVAIIGMACRFPDAPDTSAFWENLEAGRASFRDVPKDRWDHSLFQSDVPREHDKTYVRKGAFLDDVASFAALHFGIAPRRVAVMDPQHRLLLETVRVALQDAGLENASFDRSQMGTFLGVSSSEYRTLLSARTLAMQMAAGAMGETSESAAAAIAGAVKNVEPISAFSIPGTLLNMTAANVAHLWNLGGPAYSIDAACASALVAVYDAVTFLRAGACESALAGGVYLNLTPENLIGFARATAVSKSGACRPFDAESDGFLQGEGAAVLVLKRLDAAVRDGDRIWAVIRGIGINNDGNTSDGPMAPSQSGQADCLRRAWNDAGLEPGTVDLVECHGTATRAGDPVEVAALREVISSGRRPDHPILLTSVKGNIGHTMSAAGVAGLVRAALSLHHQTVPPQAGYSKPNPLLKLEDGLFEVPRAAVPWPRREGRPRRAGVSSFGFGGTNCHLVLEEAPPRPGATLSVPASPPDHELFVLAASDRALLARHAAEVARAVESDSGASLGAIAYSLTAARRHDPVRLAVVASSREDLIASLRSASAEIGGSAPLSLRLAPNVFVTPTGAEGAPKVAFMFPGQGAQRVGLLRWMFERFEGFRTRLLALEQVLDGMLERPLLSYLYPPSPNGAPSSGERKEAEERLQATEICQPAMAALGLALADFIKELGVLPSASLGHSLGEFVAAASGGILAPEDALRFVARRGRLMADLALDDPGAMAAVRADRATVGKFVIPGVRVANFNHPRQTVISGETKAVQAAMVALEAAGIPSRALRVSHAFHSHLMEGVGRDLAKVLSELALHAPETPVVSAITGAPYGERLDETRETFTRHATASVDYMAALERCSELGVDFFLEVGAGTTLTSFVTATLKPERYRAAGPLAAADDDRGLELFRTLGMLTVLGQPMELAKLYPGRQVVTLPAAPLLMERYWAIRASGAAPVVAAPTSQPAKESQSPGDRPVSDDLIKLFREQNAILAQHAEILARQAAALGGQAFVPAPPPEAKDTPVPSAPGPSRPVGPAPLEPKSGSALPPAKRVDVRDGVMAAVSKVSAFPKNALKPTQTLVGDLGLDSLMIVELVTTLQNAFPGLGEIPQSMLNQKTTIANLVDYIEPRTGSASPTAVPEQAPSAAEARRFRPVAVARPRSAFGSEPLPESAWTLLTTDGGPVGDALAAALQADGRQVAVVKLIDAGAIPPPPSVPDPVNRRVDLEWPRELERVDTLFAILAGAGIRPAALIHAADLGLSNPLAKELASSPAGWPNPVPLVHRLATALWKVEGKPQSLAVVTGMGGRFGLGDGGGAQVWQAGLSGFAKALSREWDAPVKAIDTDPSRPVEGIAAQVIDELDSASRDAEVGFAGGTRHVISLVEEPFEGGDGLPFDSKSVVMVTGGGRGLGAKLSLDLATRTRCSLLIVDAAADADVAPQLEAMRKAGSKVEYVRWDVRLAAPAELARARASLGPVTAVVHCAGVIRDRRLEEKRLADLRLVMDVKIAGLLNLMRALASDPLTHLVAFSSWSGRFGNAAQTDYSAANELMNRLVAQLPSLRPGLKAASLAWPPWESSAMAQSIPAGLREAMRREGVPFLADDAGLAALRRQLSSSSGGELLIAPSMPVERRELKAWVPLSLETHPFLGDHRVKGVPILPMASALDLTMALALESVGGPVELRGLQLFNGIEVAQPTVVTAELRVRQGVRQIELGAGGKVCYRAQAVAAASASEVAQQAPKVPADSTRRDLPMTLEAFYREVAFHGPILQGIERVEELGSKHLVGWVRPSVPADWMTKPWQAQWAVDPLVVDSAFQLVLYWLHAENGKAALPVGIERFVQLAPFGTAAVKATLVLVEVTEGTLTGSIAFHDASGKLLAVMIGAQAKVLDAGVREPSDRAEGGNGKANGSAVVDESTWRIEKFPAVEELYQRIHGAEAMGLRNPYFHVNDGVARDTSVVDGQEMIHFSGYNYLGLSGHPNVSAAAKAAVDRYGTSVSASRVASGEKPLHRELEKAIADFLGCEAAVAFSAGHATNETIIGNLFVDGDLILHDALAHNSIQQGAMLSGAKRRPFPHNDWKALDALLSQLRGHFKKVLVAVEGVYSMDGDFPDLPRFVELREKHRFILFVDEAHSMGVMGKTGRGIGEHFGVKRTDVDVWMGTLSKSFASCGGYVAGRQPLVDLVKYTAPGFVFSAGLSPANAGAARAAIAEIVAHPELVERLRRQSKLFLTLAKAEGIDTGMSDQSAVIPCIVGNSLICMQLSQRLAERGINVQPIVYPAVDEDAARLRFFLSATHTDEQIRRTVDTIAEELAKLRAAAGHRGQEAEAR